MKINYVTVQFDCENSIAGSTYHLHDNYAFLKFVKNLKEPSIRIAESNDSYYIKLYCSKDDFDVYKRLEGMCYNSFEFVTSSLMYYSLSKNNNYYRLKYVTNEDNNDVEEYIKYLEQKDKLEENRSIGYPDSPLPFLTLIFVVIIILGFVMNKAIGVGAIGLYIIIVIASLIEDSKNKKEIEKKKDIDLKSLASIYYGNIAFKKIKRELKM